MFKAIVLLTRRADLSPAEFREWWLGRHAELARGLPGLRELRFNLVEADSMEEAVRMAHELPWTAYGSIEVRPIGDFEAMRQRVGA